MSRCQKKGRPRIQGQLLGRLSKPSVLVSSRVELIFLPVAAVFWI